VSSVHKLPGKPNWLCFYTDHAGKRRCKSTMTTDKREAERVCNELQKVEDKARSGHLTPDRARKVIETAVAEIMTSLGVPLEQKSIREHFESWTKARQRECSEGTFKRYAGVAAAFIEFLGPKAQRPLSSLSSDDVERYRGKLAGNVSNATTNTHLKVIRICLEKAVKQHIFDRNPARMVENLDRSERHHRRAFTEEEIKKLLASADADWRTMILVGLYSGIRLKDISSLTWDKIHLDHDEIEVVAEIKTDETQLAAIAEPLKRHLKTLVAVGKEPLCPTLFGRKESWLSNQFWEVMAKAGLVVSRRIHKKKKLGRGMKREQSEIVFHSLRHTATSLLKRAGVSGAIAQDIIGHESEAVSRNYTHIDHATKKKAVDLMPDFTK
jgi:integrase